MVNVCGIVALVGISVIVFAFLVLLTMLCYGYNKILNYFLYVVDPKLYSLEDLNAMSASTPTSDSSTDEISFDELEEFVAEK